MIRFVLPLLLLATTAAPVFAEEKKEVRIRTVKLELSPAPELVPALKIELLPNLLDQTPGNAAPLYYQAALLAAQVDEDTLTRAVHWTEEVPPHELPREEVRKALAAFEATLHQIELAARRSRCDWDLPIQSEGFYLWIPELQRLRTVAQVLALKAKLEMAEGEFDQAVHTLQTGYAMSRHMAEESTLIHGLVAVAVGRILNYRLEEGLIQARNSQNLYWALTALPHPMVDLRAAMETEQFSLFFTCPTLREIHSGPFSLQQNENLFKELSTFLAWATDSGEPHLKEMPSLETWVEKAYPHARQGMLSRGYDPAQIEDMPQLQVVSLHSLEIYTRLRDDLFRWFHLPFPQALPKIQKVRQTLLNTKTQWEEIPFAPLMFPALESAYRATTRLDQQIAMLRCVEAIRIYAAAHDGQLPGSLAEITQVPIPLDPVTGKAFHYKVKENRALLEGAPTRTQDRYEITIRPM